MRSTACWAATPTQSSAKRTRWPSTSPSAAAIGRERHLRHALALGPVEMAAHDDLGALAGEFADGGRQAFDARQVGDLAVADGNVEVGAQQDALAGDVQVIEGAKGHGELRTPLPLAGEVEARSDEGEGDRADACHAAASRTRVPTRSPSPALRGDLSRAAGEVYSADPSSAAVSDMRLEKPHSLSYQPITRVSAPSTTAVWVASKVHDAGQWLKSMLTSGAVL